MTIFAALLTALPPDTGSAAEELSRELAQPVYATSWWDRFQAWIGEFLLVRTGQGDLSRLGWILLALAALAIATVVAVAIRQRQQRRPEPRDVEPGMFGEPRPLTAEEYRGRAEEHERAGRHEGAVLDRYRAIAARAVETGLVVDAPDLTAHEVGQRLAATHPQHSTAVQEAGHLFDLVRYGGGRATHDDVERLADLDTALLATEPAPVGPPVGPVVPR